MERLRELDHPHICKTLDAFEDGKGGTELANQSVDPESSRWFGWIFKASHEYHPIFHGMFHMFFGFSMAIFHMIRIFHGISGIFHGDFP